VSSGAVAKRLRRGAIAFSVIGVSLLGGALATVVHSRVYQARQGRAFSDLERTVATPAAGPTAPAAGATPAPPLLPPGADPLLLGRIEIPRIGLSAMVREGDDVATLAIAVGRIPGTARPGEQGNMALAGHRDSFFRALRHVRVADLIHLSAPGARYDYRVVSTEVVGPSEMRVLDPTDEAVLTLVTCYPFGFVGNAPDRFIVRAVRLPI
jgi:sortase A